jgi:hypothetical protein
LSPDGLQQSPSPAYSLALGWGVANARGAEHSRDGVPLVKIKWLNFCPFYLKLYIYNKKQTKNKKLKQQTNKNKNKQTKTKTKTKTKTTNNKRRLRKRIEDLFINIYIIKKRLKPTLLGCSLLAVLSPP